MVGILWPAQQQQARQVVDEDEADPPGHAMRARRLERPVERDDRVDDATHVHQDSEYEVLGEQRQTFGGRRQKTGHQNL